MTNCKRCNVTFEKKRRKIFCTRQCSQMFHNAHNGMARNAYKTKYVGEFELEYHELDLTHEL